MDREQGVDPQLSLSSVEQAYYARDAEIKASAHGRAPAAIVCRTLDEFIVKLTEDGYPVDTAYLAANNPWLQRQLHTPVTLGNRPFVVGRRPIGRETPPPRQPDLMLNDTGPFRLSRNHFMIEPCEEGYHVRDLCSTLGSIANGQRIGGHFRTDDALLRAGENEVIAGGRIRRLSFRCAYPNHPRHLVFAIMPGARSRSYKLIALDDQTGAESRAAAGKTGSGSNSVANSIAKSSWW